jgi:hypothetical protein
MYVYTDEFFREQCVLNRPARWLFLLVELIFVFNKAVIVK